MSNYRRRTSPAKTFHPMPRAWTDARRSAEITTTDWALGNDLIRLADPYSGTLSITLAHLMEEVQWDKSDRWLVMTLRSLRGGGWIAYEDPRPGPGTTFEITLTKDRLYRSHAKTRRPKGSRTKADETGYTPPTPEQGMTFEQYEAMVMEATKALGIEALSTSDLLRIFESGKPA
jgi:hypothetical protein